jgi:hypothetical protein
LAYFFDYHDFNWNFCHSASTSNKNRTKKLFRFLKNFLKKLIFLFKVLIMTLILIGWIRKYDEKQDIDVNDENSFQRSQQV